MFSSENRVQRVVRTIIEILTLLTGIAAVVLAVLTFINTKANSFMFPIIFILGAGMNILSGIKFVMTNNKGGAIARFVSGIVLIGISAVSYMTIGG